jgi:outer membrane receptor protein involved in Fe transport
MPMKYALLILLSISYFSVYANKGNIYGTIKDNNTSDKIPFATVAVLQDKDPAPFAGTVSNNIGDFSIDNLPFGEYSLVVSFIGYKSDTITDILINNQSSIFNVGEISLSPSTVDLGEVKVTKTVSAVNTKIDRKTYRANDFETAKGGTAVDLLNKLPSISVSPDGVVSVRGTNDFLVYLNGKPTLMDPSMLLSQISSDAIKNIEVISVPTARYDAQGKGGIINIITNTAGKEGLSISANGLVGGAPWGDKTGPYSGYEQNDNRYGGGLNLNYTKNKLSLYGGVYLNNKYVNGQRTGDARLLQENGSYYHMVASGERPEWYEYYSANGGFSFDITKNANISASYFYGNRTEGRSAFYVYNNFFGDIDKNPINGVPTEEDWVYNPNTDNRYGVTQMGNVDFNQKFSNKSELSLSFVFEHSDLSRILDNQNFDYNPATDATGEIEKHFNQTDDTPLDGYRLSIDYNKELNNGNVFSIGFQPQYLENSGSFSYDTLNANTNIWNDYSSLENAIDLTRTIYAGYIDYKGSYGKLNFIAGVRGEYTDQTLDINNPDYFNIFNRETESRYEVNQLDWFPTLHLQYNCSDLSNITFAASRRISRPPTKNMAPFLYRRHYEVYVVGDPTLEPEYLTNFELGVDKKIGKQSFNLTGFYRGTDNAIFRVNTIFEEDNVLIRSYTNSGNSKALGAELNSNLVLSSFAKLFLGGSLYNYRIEGDIFGYKEDNSSTNWSLKGNLNLNLTKTLKFTTDFNMQSATVTAQGSNDLFYTVNTALSCSPKKMKGWGFSVKALDIFSSNITGLNTRAYNTSGDQIFYQETEYTRYGPIVEVSASYSLNWNGKSKKESKNTFGNEQF